MSLSEATDNKKSMYSDKPDWGTPESTKKAKKKTPGEETTEEVKKRPTFVDIANARIEREKKSDAKRHDSMMDRARLKQTKVKNRETKPNE